MVSSPTLRTAAGILVVLLAAGILFASMFWLTLTIIFLLILPGYVLTRILLDTTPLHSILFGGGAGMAALACYVYTLSATGVPVNVVSLGAYTLVFLGLLLRADPGSPAISQIPSPSWQGIALMGIALLGLLTRVVPVTGLNAPLYGDPVVEGTIARLIVTHAGIPATWEPFAPVALHHQPGFAGIVASLHVLSGTSLMRIVLLFTNLLLALLPIPVYVLAMEMFGDRRTGLIAALITLVSGFPTYTFFAGMNSANAAFFLLPVLLAVFVRTLYRFDARSAAFLALMGTGTLLIHPLPVFLFGVLAATYAVYWLSTVRWDPRRVLLVAIPAVLIPLLLTLPHYLPILAGDPVLATEQWEIQSDFINPQDRATVYMAVEPFFVLFDNAEHIWFRYLTDYSLRGIAALNPVAIVMVAVLLYTLIHIAGRRSRIGGLLVTWYGLFLFLGPYQAAWKIMFPGWQFVYPSRVKFFIILPLALLMAYGFARRIEVPPLHRSVPLVLVLIFIAPLSLDAVNTRVNDIAEEDVVADTDVAAMAWIDANVPDDSMVLTSLLWTEAAAFIGGPGQWIPSATGVPILYPATSLTGDIAGLQDRVAVVRAVQERNRSRFMTLSKEYGITHVYVSRNAAPPWGTDFAPLNVSAVQDVCACTKRYENSDVTIFEVDR